MQQANPDWRGILIDAGKNPMPSEEELGDAVESTDIVVLGMSSKKTAGIERSAAGFAVSLQKPVVLFEDTWGCHARAWFRDLQYLAQGILVPTDSEIDPAQASFPKAKPIVVGNPAWEQDFYTYGSSPDARQLMEVREGERVIFISGTKDVPVNLELLELALDGADLLARPELRIVFSQHPGDGGGDKQEAEANLKRYQEVAHAHPHARSSILPKTIPGKGLVFGADVVLTYNAASLAVATVARRMPLLCVSTPLASDRLLAESGTRVNPLVVAEAAVDGGATPASFAEALVGSLDWCDQIKRSGGIEHWRCLAQNRFLPKPKPREYLDRFTAAVNRF